MKNILGLLLILLPLLAGAQTSTSFSLTESTFNQGGNPEDGSTASSTNFEISLDAVGDGLSKADLNSASFQADSGLVPDNPPPGEVISLAFSDSDTLVWSVENSTGSYSLYRGDIANLAAKYGGCLASGVIPATTDDTVLPVSGQTFFYLVTAGNRLLEEGTMGADSVGSKRANSNPCP